MIATTAAMLVLLAHPVWAHGSPATACSVSKLAAEGREAAALLACHGVAAKRGIAVDATCLERAGRKLLATYAKAEAGAIAKGTHCFVEGDAGATAAAVDGFVAGVVAKLRLAPDPSKCTAAKLKAIGRDASRRFAAQAANTRKVDPKRLAARLEKAAGALAKALASADTLADGNCFASGDGGAGGVDVLVGGSLPPCERRPFTDAEMTRAAAAAVESVGDPWAAGLEQVVESTAANLSCNARGTGGLAPPLVGAQAATDCATTYCPTVMYCGPGNAQSRPNAYHPEIGQCLNQACYHHDLCYNPYCVDVANECYFTGQAGSGQCDIDLQQACNDPDCIATDASSSGWRRRCTCAVIDHLMAREPAEICTQPPCQGTTCNATTGVCTDAAAQCCVDNQGCPTETGTSCAATCCCCGSGQRCCADNSGCCPA